MEYHADHIRLDKVLNNLDKFTLDFTKELEKHTPYVLVSGYVSILFGRSRISEDIDLLIPKVSKEQFNAMHISLNKSFWCLNTESIDELYDLLITKHSIRYARKEKVIPNMEVKFSRSEVDQTTFKERIKVVVGEQTLYISPIELQIAYKEEILKSEKDIEDAFHLREVFKDHISDEKIKNSIAFIKEHERRK